ncbi:MAG: ATP-binding protein [Bacteroidales bacterium]|nr:ATP-binding protein [Bacteroidales bacterium]
MLKRKITDYLKHWKETHRNECLLVRGARQIGKTFIIEDFAKNNYEHFVEINFEQRPALKSAFEGELTIQEMIKRISLYIPEAVFEPRKTLVFFDEIQSCPQARTSLKFWASDGSYDVIASGSLLGVNYNAVSSFPVGYERQVDMYSLDFEEFLWALGISPDVIASLRSHFDDRVKIDESIHQKMLQYLREYMVVGGMPEVVNTYIATNNFGNVHQTQEKIVSAYLNDIAKYAASAERIKARDCFLSIPRQLAKENTKFQYSVVESQGTARKYGNSLDWLRDAGIISYCYNLSTLQFPLPAYVKGDQFRIYMGDIGLLVSMYGFEMKAALLDDSFSGPAKGGVYENLMADFLHKKNLPLYYYKKDDTSVEIEFVLTSGISPVPVEVKSKNGRTQSLNTVLTWQGINLGYKFGTCNVGVDGKKVSMPLYLAMYL